MSVQYSPERCNIIYEENINAKIQESNKGRPYAATRVCKAVEGKSSNRPIHCRLNKEG